MSQAQVELQGTLQPDGTLILDEKPNLPAGRVNVVVQSISGAPSNTDPWAVLEHIWAEREALGLQPRTAQEIEAKINKLRDEWEDHQQSLERLQGVDRPKEEKPAC